MDASVSDTLVLERIARVLAAWHASANAEGTASSAGAQVNREWPREIDAAVALLKTLREPDRAMAAVGDADLWSRMVDAAIAARARMNLPDGGFPDLPEVHKSDQDVGRTRTDERIDDSFPASDPAPVNPGIG